jgi:hypothetical protein
MRSLLLIILCLPVITSFAQDSLRVAQKSDSLLGRIDSLSAYQLRLTHSLEKLDTLRSPINKADSLRTGITSKITTKTSIVANKESEVTQYTSKITSLQSRLTSKIDSLSTLPKPDKELIGSLDSLRAKLEDLKSPQLMNDIKSTVDKTQSVTRGVEVRIGSIEKKINDKIGLFSANGGNVKSINLPGIGRGADIGDAKLPSLQTKIPNINLESPDLSVGSVNTSIPGVGKVNDDLGVPGEKLSEITKTNQPGSLTDKLGDISKVSQEIGGYQKDVRSVSEGELKDLQHFQSTAEKKLENIDAMKDVKEHTSDYSAMMNKWNSDPDVMKQMALSKAKEEAVNHFAGHETELKSGMDQLAKIKSKTKDADAVIDLFGKRSHSMKGRGIERLVPGLDLQLQIGSHQWVDLNVHAGFRLNSRLTVGTGWTERVAMSVKDRTFIPAERAYGPRTFVEFKFREGIHLKMESDLLNAQVKPSAVTGLADPNHRIWTWSWFAGAKKSFSVNPRLRGNVQVLYNLHNPDNRSPYMSRVNVRMGMELPLKKKPKAIQ